jgi:polysaccharide export outer membrane protein
VIPRASALRTAIATVAGGAWLLLLASCAAPGASRDGGPGGEAQVPARDAEALAQGVVYAGLTRGVERYQLAPGDVLRFIFSGNPQPQQAEYVIAVRDRLRMDFFYHPQLSRTHLVRPDGRITLPLRGDVDAAGRTPEQLAARVRELYQDVYRDPVVTVSVEEFSSALGDLTEALKGSAQGRAKEVVVSPDGLAFVPLLPPIKAGGRTVEELQNEVNGLYARRYGDLAVSVSLEKVAGDRVFVFGEVRNPGMLALSGPKTTLQAITAAGGPLVTGTLERVKVLYWSADGESRLRTLDLQAAFEEGKVSGDLLLPANTVVYVPPTEIAKLDRFVDQYIRQVFLFNGWGFNLFYNLNPQTSVSVPR